MNEKIRDIAARIKGLRLLSGLTPEEVAKVVNVTPEAYSQYESGEDDIPVSLLNEISEFYKVDMTEILTGISPKLRDVCMVKMGRGSGLSATTSMNLKAWPTSMRDVNRTPSGDTQTGAITRTGFPQGTGVQLLP